MPSAASLELAFQTSSNQFFQTTKVFDRTGQKVLYEVIDPRAGDRQWLDLEQIPVRFQTATISIEDKTFYQNAGYDLLGMLRAFGANLSRPICVLRPEDCPGLIQGGSTITQQLVKNVIIAPGMYADTSYSRKLREVLIAREATTRYNKAQILEWYLNTNFYGNLAYGIDAASRVYFGKPAVQLSLSESALLASIPQSPGLNPIDAPESARKRQVLVLDSMVEQGYISDEAARAALAADVFARFKRIDNHKVHFLTGTDEHGLKIQKAAEKNNLDPLDYCNKISKIFEDLAKKLNLSNNDFIRTTEKRHYKSVNDIWNSCLLYTSDAADE
mgnify:CR=1 FL=1